MPDTIPSTVRVCIFLSFVVTCIGYSTSTNGLIDPGQTRFLVAVSFIRCPSNSLFGYPLVPNLPEVQMAKISAINKRVLDSRKI